MEVRLNFIEEDFRAFYANNRKALLADLSRELNWRKKVTQALIALTVFCFGLTYVDWRWVNYGLFPLGATLAFIVWTEIIKYGVNQHIRSNRVEEELFYVDRKKIEDVRYVVDEHEIRYYGAGELKQTFFWTDLSRLEYYEECFVLYMNPKNTSLTFFRSMIDKTELDLFERMVVEKLKEVRETY
jgi:hypothetical protein